MTPTGGQELLKGETSRLVQVDLSDGGYYFVTYCSPAVGCWKGEEREEEREEEHRCW
jgi:hypothetical protein